MRVSVQNRAAVAGIAAAIAGLGVAELVGAMAAATSTPLFVVGALAIDLAPGPVKELTISVLGPADKPVLLVLLALLGLALAAMAGVVERRKPPLGRVLIAVVGLVAVLAAVTRADAGALSAAPSIAAALTAMLILPWLLRRVRDTDAAPAGEFGRRAFLKAAGATAGVGVLALVLGRMLTAGPEVAAKARAMFRLPRPAVSAAAIPPGARLDVAGISPLITPNESFYRIDTALQVPRIDASEWTLKISGMVEHPLTLTFDELIALPLEESRTTLACVSNYVGGDLIGTATWLGYPIRKLLQRAQPHPDADMVLSTSADGFTAGTPLSVLTDARNAILAIGMNGEPLPFEHGYPVRMVVPGLFGYVSATKWVTQLKLTTFEKDRAYWTNQGWSERGPVKLSSRIDVPRAGSTVNRGPVAVAGVAWRQHVGVSRVQVRVDDGDWHDAQRAEPLSADTWLQWVWRWEATEGKHTLTVRATDATGEVQTSRATDVVPDGATGLHSVEVTVT